jgi:GNAT superfamily N-acetyltransferase
MRDGTAVGYAHWTHVDWERMPERFVRGYAELRPMERTAARLDALVAFLEEEARREGGRQLSVWAFDDDPLKIGVLTDRGFHEERRQRFWQLDLAANRARIERMAAESRARMQREGIQVLTLDQDHDPRKWEKLKRMSDEAEADVPSTVPFVSMPMAEWMKWFDSPALRPDRIWLAREGEDIVGISQLAYPPVRGVVMTDWTATARKVRGRGVARALKCEALVQAIALGVDRVRTDNDSANAPILHINETMGYRIRVEGIQFLKEL